MSALLELAERCEKATGPERILDAHIDAICRIGAEKKLPDWAWRNFSHWRPRDDGRVEVVSLDGTGGLHWEPRRFTSSIDAALTLLPENICWPSLAVYENGLFGAHCKLYGPSTKWMSDSIVWGEAHVKPMKSARYTDATELWPLAICAAALRARAAVPPERPQSEEG